MLRSTLHLADRVAPDEPPTITAGLHPCISGDPDPDRFELRQAGQTGVPALGVGRWSLVLAHPEALVLQ